MRLPEKIKGKNRIRDGAIVLYFKKYKLDYPALAVKFNLSQRRILQILSVNHAFIKRDKEWEREKRINILERLIDKNKDSTSRDIVDLLEAQKKEIDGNENSGSSNSTRVIIIKESRGDDGNQNQRGNVPGQVSVLRV